MESLIPVYFECGKCGWSFDGLYELHVCNEYGNQIEDWRIFYCPMCGEDALSKGKFDGKKRRDTDD